MDQIQLDKQKREKDSWDQHWTIKSASTTNQQSLQSQLNTLLNYPFTRFPIHFSTILFLISIAYQLSFPWSNAISTIFSISLAFLYCAWVRVQSRRNKITHIGWHFLLYRARRDLLFHHSWYNIHQSYARYVITFASYVVMFLNSICMFFIITHPKANTSHFYLFRATRNSLLLDSSISDHNISSTIISMLYHPSIPTINRILSALIETISYSSILLIPFMIFYQESSFHDSIQYFR